MKNKLKKEINRFLADRDETYEDFRTSIESYYRDEELYELTSWLESEKLINYTINNRQTDSDNWLQAEIGATIGGKFVGIIFDYDVSVRIETIDELIEDLLGYEKRAKEIIKILKAVK